ncbi:MAG TPA: hypothetical protein DCY88_32800, partial [Cyanobacteria bacterium UBA11372]|nr:hypothetical protein [Cyanobacteria bacterium UBA11372]
VIELRSATDDLETLREKMREYIDAGVQLAWLINPQQQQVEIYRPGEDVEVRNLPTELSGENVLPEFSLNLSLYSGLQSHEVHLGLCSGTLKGAATQTKP